MQPDYLSEQTNSIKLKPLKKLNKELKTKLISGRIYPDFFKISGKQKILNIGIGYGPQAMAFADRYKYMVGTDINLNKINSFNRLNCNWKLPVYNCICNVENLPFKNCVFDSAIAIDILEHLNKPQLMMQDLHRVLREKGNLLISFPCMLDTWTSYLKKIGRYLALKKHLPRLSQTKGNIVHKIFDMDSLYFHTSTNQSEPYSPSKLKSVEHYNPDSHKHHFTVKKWMEIIESVGFEFLKKRSTTLFPPLHTIGIKKFWYTNNTIYKVDSALSSVPLLKQFGQSMLCLLQRKNQKI